MGSEGRFVCVLMLGLAVACGGDSGGQRDAEPAPSREPTGAGPAQPATDETEASSGPLYTCASTPTQPCYCAHGGTLEGTQTCVPDALTGAAMVGPCSGCASQGPSEVADAAALCPQLREMVGCEATTFRSEELPASVLFVVDRSGSMLCNAPPAQASADCGVEPLDASLPTKWDITVESLDTAFEGLVGTNVNAALAFFSLDDECSTESDPAVSLSGLSAQHATALNDALGAQTPQGRTPIVSALINAYNYMHWEAFAGCPIEPCGAPGNRFVVLLTDGAESCASAEDQRRLLTETVPDAVDANIRTFVIGAPGSEPGRAFLSELAFQGGTARSDACLHDASGEGDSGDCHFDMTTTMDFAEDLRAVLGDIGGSIGCSFAIEGTGSVNVQYALAEGEPSCLEQSNALPCAGGAEGWQFARRPDGTDDPSQVVICGSACDSIRGNTEAQVDIVLGCTTLTGPD